MRARREKEREWVCVCGRRRESERDMHMEPDIHVTKQIKEESNCTYLSDWRVVFPCSIVARAGAAASVRPVSAKLGEKFQVPW